MRTWKEKHPDFEYILWTERELTQRGFQTQCQEPLNWMKEINGQADILRWEILYQYGGYFVDADSICIEPFDFVFENATGFATFENENIRLGLVATGTMGFVPGHPLCYDIIQWMRSSEEAKRLIHETRAWYSVGPGLLTRMLETGKYKDFTVFPSYMFLPNHFTGLKYNGHKKVYGYQEWGTSNNSYDTMNSVVLPSEFASPPSSEWYSVLVTSYNTNIGYVRECLNSIKNQTGYFGIELVWVNDGSSPENTKLLEKELEHFRATSRFTRVVYSKNEENRGTAFSSNVGLGLCSSELVFKMDSDDIMLPNRMTVQIDFMRKNPEACLCGANIHMFTPFRIEDAQSNRSNPFISAPEGGILNENWCKTDTVNPSKKIVTRTTAHPLKITWEEIQKTKPEWFMNNPTVCYRKSAVESVGGYRLDNPRILYICEDYDLLVRLLKKYDVLYNLNDVLVMYRIHPGQLTANIDKMPVKELIDESIANAIG
jgi:glycosyltransferase involved in cell wall biosynthesis